MEDKRRIIYVDAGNENSDNFKISLYDMTSNATHIMELLEIKDNNEAERYAIYYAIFYIYKNNFSNCMILSDNKGATQDKVIALLLNDLDIQISWIPREINKIADKTCKREATLKENDFAILTLFIKLSKKAYKKDETPIQDDKLKIQELETRMKKKDEKIKNQKNQINHLRKKITC